MMSADQKKLVKIFILYGAGYVVLYPLFHWLFTKEFSWDSVLTAGISAVAGLIIGLLFVIGSKVPEK